MHIEFLLAAADPLTELTTNFGVNGPKFLAQLIAFSIVAAVLAKFAIAPVQKMLAERQDKIDTALAEAEKIKLDVQQAEAQRREIIRKANEQANQIIQQAVQAAEVQGQKKLQEAAQEAERVIEKAHEATRLERARMEGILRREIMRLVADATQRVIGRSLTTDDHKRLNEETVEYVSRNWLT